MTTAATRPMPRAGHLLIRGATLRVASMTINIAGTFMVLPFMIHQLGDYWYGIWALIGAIVVQYHILDFGLSQTVVRFIAKHRGEQAPAEMAAVFSTALAAFGAFGAVTFIGVAGLAATVPAWGFPPAEAEILAAAILMVGATMCCAFPTYAAEGCFTGVLRQDIPSLLQIVRTVLRLSLTYYFIAEGYSIMALAAISLGCDTLYRLQLAWLLPRIVPEARFDRRAISLRRLREMLRFGRFVLLTNVARYSVIHTSMIIAGAFVGVAAATTYAIALNIIERLEGITRMALSMTMPAFSGLMGHGDPPFVLQQRFLMVSRIVGLGISLLCGGLIVAGQPFVTAWMGPDYAAAYWPLLILSIAWMADLAQVPAMQVLTALGQHRQFAMYDLAVAAASAALAMLLSPGFGLPGIAAGVAVPVLVSAILLKPRFAARALHLPARILYRETGRTVGGALLLQVPVAIGLQQMTTPTILELALFGAATYGPIGLIAALTLLPRSDQRYLVGLLPYRTARTIRTCLPYLRETA